MNARIVEESKVHEANSRNTVMLSRDLEGQSEASTASVCSVRTNGTHTTVSITL